MTLRPWTEAAPIGESFLSGNSNANKFMTRSEFDMKYHWRKVASHTKRGKRNQFRHANLIWISKRIISIRKEWDENQRVSNMISSKFNKRIVLMSMSVVIISAHQRNINYDDVAEEIYAKVLLKRDDDEEAYEHDGAAVEASRKLLLAINPHPP